MQKVCQLEKLSAKKDSAKCKPGECEYCGWFITENELRKTKERRTVINRKAKEKIEYERPNKKRKRK